MNLLAYIQGKRKGKEAHRIEKEAMRDPFMADALEGYDEVKADHAERIARLRSRMPSATRSIGQQKIYMGIAASLLFCLAVGGYFLLNKKPENLIAMGESYEYIMTEEEIEMSPSTEAFPPPASNYLAENERLASSQGELRQREMPPPASPVISAQVQAEIVVMEAEEEMAVAWDAVIAAARVGATEEMAAVSDNVEVAALGGARVLESKSVVATRAMRSDSAKEESSTPEPQIGMEAYQAYLQEAKSPLQQEECAQAQGVVEVEFTLTAGKPHSFIIKRSFCDAASKEAIRLIENGSPWICEDGQKVVLMVNF